VPDDHKPTIATLNALLRGEIAASQSYALALSKLHASANRLVLEQCALSHDKRVQRLTGEVERLGGSAAVDPGVSAAFDKVRKQGSEMFGELSLIAALEEGESVAKDDYDVDLTILEAGARAVLEVELKPEQLRTCQTMAALQAAQAR
jgi:Domain of unknown function (DUF2383)